MWGLCVARTSKAIHVLPTCSEAGLRVPARALVGKACPAVQPLPCRPLGFGSWGAKCFVEMPREVDREIPILISGLVRVRLSTFDHRPSRLLDEMSDVNFRKIDIDAYDEDVLIETELYDADPRGPAQVLNDTKQKATAVRSALSK